MMLRGATRWLFYYSYRRLSRFTHWSERRLTGVGRVVVTATLAFTLFGIDTERSTAYQGFAFLASLLVLSVAFLSVTSMTYRGRFGVTRELPRFATAGQPLEYRVRVRKAGNASGGRSGRAERGLTLYEDLAFAWPTRAELSRAREPGVKRNRIDEFMGFYAWTWLLAERRNGTVESRDLPALPAGGEVAVNVRVTPRRRGTLRFAGVSLARTDPLRLCRAFVRNPLPQSVLVLPRRYRLAPITLAGHRRYQPGGVALASSAGDSEEFFGLRDYQPGDPLQRMHWKSFARLGQPIVKEFQTEFFERHALALDTAPDPAGDADGLAFEEAVSVAASFVHTLDTQECLLDMLFVGEQAHVYTAGRGLLRAEHLLEVLAGVQQHGGVGPAEGGPLDDGRQAGTLQRLEQAVLERRGELSGCILVLCGWDPDRRRLVDALRGAGLQLLVLAVVGEATSIDPVAGVRRVRVGHVQEDLLSL